VHGVPSAEFENLLDVCAVDMMDGIAPSKRKARMIMRGNEKGYY
jgi:hypothetical protein